MSQDSPTPAGEALGSVEECSSCSTTPRQA